MRVGPTFALVLGCSAKCDYGHPPGPMCVLFQGASATSTIETSDKDWELSDSGISSQAQSICRVAERGSEGIKLKQGCCRGMSLSREARPVKLLSLTLKFRYAVLYYC